MGALLDAQVKDCDSTRQWLEKAAIARNESAKRALRSGVVAPRYALILPPGANPAADLIFGNATVHSLST